MNVLGHDAKSIVGRSDGMFGRMCVFPIRLCVRAPYVKLQPFCGRDSGNAQQHRHLYVEEWPSVLAAKPFIQSPMTTRC